MIKWLNYLENLLVLFLLKLIVKFNNDDNKTKFTPLESYYEVNDVREEKYIISNR